MWGLQQLWLTGLVAACHVESSWSGHRTYVPCIGRFLSTVPPGKSQEKLFIKRDSLCTKEKVAKKKTHNYKTKLSAPGVERVSSFYDKREGLSDGALKTSRNHQPSLIISRWLRDDYQE